jgi:GNAT superfamily N-acetyltransferase
MDNRKTSGAWGTASAVFRTVRLPREIEVDYPRQGEDLLAGWRRRDGFIVAEVDERVCGYATLALHPEHGLVWVGDLVVDRPQRRQGIGTALLKACAQWAGQRDMVRLTLEVQTKNYPAIEFCRACGLTFCGYNDHYWSSEDIAVFFTGRL